jgi:hypothetical protein
MSILNPEWLNCLKAKILTNARKLKDTDLCIVGFLSGLTFDICHEGNFILYASGSWHE